MTVDNEDAGGRGERGMQQRSPAGAELWMLQLFGLFTFTTASYIQTKCDTGLPDGCRYKGGDRPSDPYPGPAATLERPSVCVCSWY